MNIDKQELKQLLFWSFVGTSYSVGGSYQNKIPKTIVKYARKLKLRTGDFPYSLKKPDRNMLSNDVKMEWDKQSQRNSRRGM